MWVKQKGKNKYGEDAVTLVWHEPETTLASLPITLTPAKANKKARKKR